MLPFIWLCCFYPYQIDRSIQPLKPITRCLKPHYYFCSTTCIKFISNWLLRNLLCLFSLSASLRSSTISAWIFLWSFCPFAPADDLRIHTSIYFCAETWASSHFIFFLTHCKPRLRIKDWWIFSPKLIYPLDLSRILLFLFSLGLQVLTAVQHCWKRG